MIEREKVEEAARLKAIESVLEFAIALTYRAMKFSPVQVEAIHKILIATHQGMSLKGIDAATSDLVMAETEIAVQRLLDRASQSYDALLKITPASR